MEDLDTTLKNKSQYLEIPWDYRPGDPSSSVTLNNSEEGHYRCECPLHHQKPSTHGNQ